MHYPIRHARNATDNWTKAHVSRLPGPSFSGRLGQQVQAHELCERTGAGLSHHLGSMGFDGFHTDIQLGRYLLVQTTDNDVFHYLPFARR